MNGQMFKYFLLIPMIHRLQLTLDLHSSTAWMYFSRAFPLSPRSSASNANVMNWRASFSTD